MIADQISELNSTGYAQVVSEAFSGGTDAREFSHAYVYGLGPSLAKTPSVLRIVTVMQSTDSLMGNDAIGNS